MNDKYYKELATTLINTCDAETFFRILKQSLGKAYDHGYEVGYHEALESWCGYDRYGFVHDED